MKKRSLMFGLAAALLFFASCATSGRQFSINRIRHSEPGLENLPFNAYTVIERVSGSGSVVDAKKGSGLFDGDTGLYGSLDTQDAIYLNLAANVPVAPVTAFDAALANAAYQMIEKADKLGADAVIFVRTKTKVSDENGRRTISVEVSGTAVKLK